MTKIRLSYSLLNAWKWGRREEAINLYLRIPTVFTPEQQKRIDLGSNFDKYVEDFVNKNKKLPPELGGLELEHPLPKMRLTLPYNEMFDLVGELDVWAKPMGIEVKCSATKDSVEYSETEQISMYFLLFDLWEEEKKSEKIMDGFYLYRFDPSHKTYDRSLVWRSKRRTDEARAMIDKMGPEIYKFFQERQVI
jgi:hypothetical protein